MEVLLLKRFIFKTLNIPRLQDLIRVKESELDDNKLYCFLCGNAITSTSERISVDGAHEHSFTNPHGYSFHIGCFRNAPGCIQEGIVTDDFSWFKGYSWRYALCADCQQHLGWIYDSQDQFYGLILDRLISTSEFN